MYVKATDKTTAADKESAITPANAATKHAEIVTAGEATVSDTTATPTVTAT